jgi:hypothetical protein
MLRHGSGNRKRRTGSRLQQLQGTGYLNLFADGSVRVGVPLIRDVTERPMTETPAGVVPVLRTLFAKCTVDAFEHTVDAVEHIVVCERPRGRRAVVVACRIVPSREQPVGSDFDRPGCELRIIHLKGAP